MIKSLESTISKLTQEKNDLMKNGDSEINRKEQKIQELMNQIKQLKDEIDLLNNKNKKQNEEIRT